MGTARRRVGYKTTRRAVQLAFLTLVLVGVFFLGANCELWCPFGGVEALYTYATEGDMLCSLGTANFFALGGVLLATLLLRRAFCGYMCPIGALSEWVGEGARRLRIPAIRVPRQLDRWLALLKYVVLAVILWLTWRAGELVFRGFDPCYALISRHGTDITVWAYIVSGIIVVASLVIVVPFCRWFCPLAAVLNPFSRFGLTRIHRHEEACSNCGLCAKACPVDIPIDETRQVTAARCMSCLNCLDSCPDKTLKAITWGPPRVLGYSWPQWALVAVLLLCTFGAAVASYVFPIPSVVKVYGAPGAQVAKVKLQIHELSCRGRANLLHFFLERDDLYQIPGYFKLEAWPGPGVVDIQVSYDPAKTNAEAIKRAITEPYYDVLADFWRMSPFRIAGYDPLAQDADLNLELDGPAPPTLPR